MGNRLGLRSHEKFAPLWVVDFPLLEWDDQTQRFYAMHHPFTSPNPEDIGLFDTDPGKIRANREQLINFFPSAAGILALGAKPC